MAKHKRRTDTVSVLLFFLYKIIKNLFSARLIFSNRIFELRRKSSGASQKGISDMSIKIILEMLQITWYGTQLIKEMKELYKWCKKRADDKSPTPNTTTEQDIPPSSSDTTITVEKNKDCNININVYPKLDK